MKLLTNIVLRLPCKRLKYLDFRYMSQSIRNVESLDNNKDYDQLQYLKSALDENNLNWPQIKNKVLSLRGKVNMKNYDAVFLKVMTTKKKYDTALSYVDFLRSSNEELALGCMNSLLGLYYAIGQERNLTELEQKCVLDIYCSLYMKYKVLDFTTCERLVHALCTINEHEKALKAFNDIYLSSTPSYSAYSILIATYFKNNKKKNAMDLIKKSVIDNRHLGHEAYLAWIDFILRKCRNKNTTVKNLEEICEYISKNFATITIQTAEKIVKTYQYLDWEAKFTQIQKTDGVCVSCKEKLALKLSKEDFQLLQQNVKSKLIVGSNLFLKTSPQELSRFASFLEKTAPYDVVIDALNIIYAYPHGHKVDKLKFLDGVVDFFIKRNKKVLILGRKHLLSWPRNTLELTMKKAYSFFTENLSQDDPYFITAAILSGPNTDIVSKDLLRGHKFLLMNDQLRSAFKMWQWQHQWMIFHTNDKGMNIQEPLKFTPCAQHKNGCWHIPYENEELNTSGLIKDGIPNLKSWICIRPKSK